MAFLDRTGVERLWAHIISKLGDKADRITLENHISNVTNPHNVTKSQLGIYVQDTEPTDITEGAIWLDTSSNGSSASNVSDHIILIDNVSGYKYAVQMKNGVLVNDMLCSGITVVTLPTKTDYYKDEVFDPEGMVVVAEYPDGTTKEITNYTCSIIAEDGTVTITYKHVLEFTTSIRIALVDFDPAIHLADFNYTSNNDGTYTITGWKGTRNGVESTEMVIPNVASIIV